MKISYQNSTWDMLRFLYHRFRVYLGILICIGAVVVGSQIWQIPREPAPAFAQTFAVVIMTLLFTVILIGMFAIFLYLMAFLTLRKHYSSSGGVLTEIILSDEEVAEHFQVGNKAWSWTDINKIVRLRRVLLIYVSHNAAHVVPRRAFDSESSWLEFVAATLRLHQGSRKV